MLLALLVSLSGFQGASLPALSRAEFHLTMSPAPQATSTVCQPGKGLDGGAKEIRTPDPLLARQVLSQLSYGPMYIWHGAKNGFGGPWWTRTTDLTLIRGAL